MSVTKQSSAEPISLREIGRQYNLSDSTLRDWIDKGVFGRKNEIEIRRIGRKDTMIFHERQIARFEQFLKYRRWFHEWTVDAIVSLLEQIELGSFDVLATVLQEAEQRFQDAAEEVNEELQRLHAQRFGEALLLDEAGI